MFGDLIKKRYRISNLIGEGGTAFVYLGYDLLRDELPIAIKIMKNIHSGSYNNISLRHFKTEYEILTRLKHPNLVRVYDFGYDNMRDSLYIAMEFIPGITLRDYLKYNKPEFGQAMDIMVSLLRAISFIHSRSILYRDIKPENIILSNNNIKLLDFGLSDLEKTEQYKMKGSVQYIAPEVFSGITDLRVDIYSLGVLLYELITGHSIFHNMDFADILAIMGKKENYEAKCNSELYRISDNRLRKLIYKMLAFDKKKRHRNCREIIRDINKLFDYNYELETKETIRSYISDIPFTGRKRELQRIKTFLHKKSDNIKALIITGAAGSGKNTILEEFKKYCKLSYIPVIEYDTSKSENRIYYPFPDIIEKMLIYSSKKLIAEYGIFLKRILPSNNLLKEHIALDTGSIINDKNIIENNMINFMISFAREYKGVFPIIAGDISKFSEDARRILSNFIKKADHIYKHNEFELNFALYFLADEENRNSTEKILSENYLSKFIKTMELKPFSEFKVYKYLQRVFGKGFIDHSIRSRIKEIRHTVGGNPLHIRSILWAVLDKEGFYFNKSKWAIRGDILDNTVLSSVVNLQRDRIKRAITDPDEINKLQMLSLINHKLTIQEVKALFGEEEGKNILFQIRKWERLDILVSENYNSKIYIKFSHSLIRKILKYGIKNKMKMHRNISCKLENMYKDGYHDILEEMIYHLLASRKYKRVSNYLIKAAIIRQEEFDYKNASNLYLKLARIQNQSQEILLYNYYQAGKMLYMSGEWDKSIKFLRKGLRLSDQISAHWFFEAIGTAYYYKGDFDSSLHNYEKSLSLRKEFFGEHSKEFADSCINIASLYQISSNYEKAKEYLYKYYVIIKRLFGTMSNEASSYYNNMGMLYFAKGKADKAFKYLHKCLKIKRKFLGNKHPHLAITYNNIGMSLEALSHNRLALKCYETCLKIRKLNFGEDFIELAPIYNNLGMIYLKEKQIMKAEENLKKAIRIWEKVHIDAHYNLYIAYNNLGMSYIAKGKYDKAYAHFILALKIYNKSSYKNPDFLSALNKKILLCKKKIRQDNT